MARLPDHEIERRAFLRLLVAGAGAAAVGSLRLPAGRADGLFGAAGDVSGLAFGGGTAVAVGRDTAGHPAVWRRGAGGDWLPAASAFPAGAVLGDVVASHDGFIAGGALDGAPAFWRSRDGSSWELMATLDAPGEITALATRDAGVLAAGAELDPETSEPSGPLLLIESGPVAWHVLPPDGLGALADGGSLTAAGSLGRHFAVAGTSAAVTGLWVGTPGGWHPIALGLPEPVVVSSLVTVGDELVALGSTISGGEPVVARARDLLRWSVVPATDALAGLGPHVAAAAVDPLTGALAVAPPGGGVASLATEALGR